MNIAPSIYQSIRRKDPKHRITKFQWICGEVKHEIPLPQQGVCFKRVQCVICGMDWDVTFDEKGGVFHFRAKVEPPVSIESDPMDYI